MKKYHITYLACTAALIGTGLGATPATAAHSALVVRPGESIQKAVNAARPGDTVLVAPGTYRESVTIRTPWVTLRGMGRGTVIEPSAKKAAGKKDAAEKGAPKEGGTKKVPKSCAEGGNGICVFGTKKRDVEGVTVANLTVTGFSKAGVFGMGTDGMTVSGVYAVKNGVWGIAQERSVRGVLRGNYARENDDAGLFLANTITEEAGALDTKGAVVEGNWLENNRIGFIARRVRNLTVANNYVTGNCGGVFVVGDENKPQAGALTVRGNRITKNNKVCPKTARLPVLQGAGVVLTGAEDTLVTRNLITDNAGKSPFAGGVVLFKSMVGAVNTRNRISYNTLRNNSPADLVNTETAKRNGNTFTRNACRVSKPSGMC
ncbi:nitrous oxide reductase family maturation protein NosD [Streptomyces sp. NPDC001978]|uniref:right-handed parallel beta-helix repeat-containing protein n=1 Tax=Streptomyces sp. NPDC001978 TaxID=3364627 RepID=UPI0036B253C0